MKTKLGFPSNQSAMPVNILNLTGLTVLNFKETDTDHYLQAEPAVITRLRPHCGRSHETALHAQKTLYIRELPSHGKSAAQMLLTDRLQQQVTMQEKLQVRKKPLFDEICMERLMCMLSKMTKHDYDIRIQTRQMNWMLTNPP